MTEPHSVPLQLLADTGLLGLALGLALAVAVAARDRAARCAACATSERAAAVALIGAAAGLRGSTPSSTTTWTSSP